MNIPRLKVQLKKKNTTDMAWVSTYKEKKLHHKSHMDAVQ